jgi:hypothetical protein
MGHEVDESVASLVRALVAAGVPEASSITIDLQTGGEHPYRVVVPDETLPLVGLATTPALSDL